MKVSKGEARVIIRALQQWRDQGMISTAQQQDLQQSLETSTLDWHQVAKYSFWIAITCILFALLSFLLDDWLIKLMQQLFSAPDIAKSALFAISTTLFCGLGLYRKRRNPNKPFSSEAFFVVAVINAGIAILFLGREIEAKNLANLVLLAGIVYALLALWIRSTIVWSCALITFGVWFGVQTYQVANEGYYLGMNFPLRFTLFGAVMTLAAHYYMRFRPDEYAFGFLTKVAGMIYLFLSLWLVSIFGNYLTFTQWNQVAQIELVGWALLLGATAIFALYYGIKYSDEVSKVFGLTFTLVNLYTRFFEYFWNDTHKALFFTLLAISFWFLGSRAESIYQIGANKSDDITK